MQFDWSFRAGDIVTAVSALTVAFSFLYKRGGSDAAIDIAVKQLTDNFDEMKTEMKTFSTALRDIAVQRSEINLLMKWYDEIRRGIGKIE